MLQTESESPDPWLWGRHTATQPRSGLGAQTGWKGRRAGEAAPRQRPACGWLAALAAEGIPVPLLGMPGGLFGPAGRQGQLPLPGLHVCSHQRLEELTTRPFCFLHKAGA